jgi:type IV pilus assembly protein PilN
VIRINLMPRAEARRQAARQRDRQIGLAIASVLALIVLISELMTRTRLNEAEHTTEMYKTQLAELERKSKEAQKLEKLRDELQAKLRTIEILERQRTGPVRVLEDLSDSTPEKLWLTEMRESGGSLSLLGRGLDNQTIAVFMEDLEESPYFNQVDLVETKQVEDGKAKLKEFSIRASVAYAAVEEEKDAPKKEREGDRGEGAAAGADDDGAGGPDGSAEQAPEQREANGSGAASGATAGVPARGGIIGTTQTARGVAADLEGRQDTRDAAARDIVEPRS